jgi:two-component system phosphate regulon sensor histidine kinase PhoR
VALVALAEVVLLLTRIRHQTQPMMPAPAGVSPLQHDRFMTRSRRIASSLRDLRNAASQSAGCGGAARSATAGALVQPRRRESARPAPAARSRRAAAAAAGNIDLSDWLQDGAQEPLNDVSRPGHPDSQINVSMLPFGRRQHLLLARDISHLNRLEQIRRDFVANVSHELRTPLTVIHGYLELLDPEDVPELAPVLGEMRAQSKRMGQIVEDLLTLSRLETQHQIADERVPMASLLATVRKEAEALSQGRHQITLESTAEADLLGSPKDLHSALSNLVSNAVRYTPTGGSITIRWQRTPEGGVFGQRHRLRHSGHAPGAAHRALLPHLVQPFARQRRHRPGPVDRQARAEPASGAVADREHAGRGLHLRLPFRPCAPADRPAAATKLTLPFRCRHLATRHGPE